MSSEKKPQEKSRLHPRNKNRDRYDLDALIIALPELKDYVKPNKYGDQSVDFSNPKAVKILNKALLKHYYGVANWDFPDSNLCPPIPGRADYIHYIADLLSQSNFGRIPKGQTITCFDVGVGASCIYPIIGATEYNWSFIGSDVDSKSIATARSIVKSNEKLQNNIELKLQKNQNDIFYGIITREDRIDVSICNPPFHSSAQDAIKGTQRKVKNLTGQKTQNPQLNFSGVSNELIFKGGEVKFITNMIRESERFSKNCMWFTSLVSKQSNLKSIYKALDRTQAKSVKTIPMGTGNKSSRIVAWTFLSPLEQKEWSATNWSQKPTK